MVGEVGVDFDRVQVAGDEQGRVVERFAVELELAVGAGQVLVRPLVLPHEAAAKEDIGVALLAPRLIGLYFKREIAAVGIIRQWRRVAHQRADVVEMALGGGAFFLLNFGPLGDELGRLHGQIVTGRRTGDEIRDTNDE